MAVLAKPSQGFQINGKPSQTAASRKPIGDVESVPPRVAKAGDYLSVQELLNAYEKLGRDILDIIEPDEILKTGLPVVMPSAEGGGSHANALRSLPPELQEAVLRLLGSERHPE